MVEVPLDWMASRERTDENVAILTARKPKRTCLRFA